MSKEAMKLAWESEEKSNPQTRYNSWCRGYEAALRGELADQPAQQERVCAWQREDDDHMPDTWRSDCGVLWTFTDGSPVDNEMKYCCGCGAMLLEKKT